MSLLDSILTGVQAAAPLVGSAFGPAGTAIGGAVALGAGGLEKLNQNDEAQANANAQMQQQIGLSDTAIQRRVADLKAAGLSPVLAAGAGASSPAPVRVDPSQQDPAQIEQAAMAMISQQSNIAHSAAETDLLQNQSQQLQDKIQNDAMLVFNPDGSAMLAADGHQYRVGELKAFADMNNSLAMGSKTQALTNQANQRAALLASGLTEQQADNALAQLSLREAAASEPYFQPWMAKGTIGGAAMDFGKGLVGAGVHILAH